MDFSGEGRLGIQEEMRRLEYIEYEQSIDRRREIDPDLIRFLDFLRDEVKKERERDKESNFRSYDR